MSKIFEKLQKRIDAAVQRSLKQITEEIAGNAELYIEDEHAYLRESVKAKVDGVQVHGKDSEDGNEEEEATPRKGQHSAVIYTDDDDGLALEFGTRDTPASPFLTKAFYEALDSGRVTGIIVSELKKEFGR